MGGMQHRPIPEEYKKAVAQVSTRVPLNLQRVMARVSARNEKTLDQFRKVVGPVPDFQGTIGRI